MTSPPEQFELESLHTAVEITPQLRPWESVIIVAAPFKSWSSHRKLKLFVASVGLKVADCRVRHGSYLPRNGRDSAGSWGVAPRDFADGGDTQENGISSRNSGRIIRVCSLP